jgi:HPt (histidine-containing phosphotransfer) domain-containing protein
VNLVFRLALTLVLLIGSAAAARSATRSPIIGGVLDLRTNSQPLNETILLEGAWRFYWQHFLLPGDKSPPNPINLKVRGTWRGAVYAGQILPAHGWGSYELLLFLRRDQGELALKIPNVGTAYRLYANGVMIASAGVPAENSADAVSRTVPVRAILPGPNSDGSIRLIMHISNYDDRHGGIWQSVELGPRELIETSFNNAHSVVLFLFGAMLMIALHHLLIFLRNPGDKSNIAFAILCILLAIRALVEGDRFILANFPQFSWILNSRLAYLSFYGSIIPAAWFLRSVFPEFFHRYVFRTILALILPLCAGVMFLQPRIYTETLTTVQILALLLIIYAGYVIVRAVIARSRGARTLAAGILIFFGAAILDILTVANVTNFPELTPYGLIAFILAQSLLISLRQEDAYRDLRLLARQNRELIDSMEVKILERTALIAELSAEGDAVLDSLSDGVFLIDQHSVIGNKVSRRTLEILELEIDQIARRRFSEFILDLTNPATAEDARLFTKVLFNADIDDAMLPQLNPLGTLSVRGLKSNTQRILRFTFTRRYKRSEIMAVFVSCRDITVDEERRAEITQKEIRAQRQLEIVRTLFSVTPEALQAFYGSIESELEDIDTALGENGGTDIKARITNVYRAAHTIKGNAQLFKVNFIAEEAHHFEEKLQTMLKKESLENMEMLGVNLEYMQMQKALSEFEEMIGKILKFQQETRGMHVNAIDVLRESLPKMVLEICAELRKEATLRFDNFSAELIPRAHIATLRDCIVQSVRNALTHSIETAAEREAKGKPRTGYIVVSAAAGGKVVRVSVRDDGRSFDLDAIRDLATAQHLRTEHEIREMSSSELINFIFLPGFSTAAKAGSHAGRGIGMDIIAKKIRLAGGKVRITWAKDTFTEFTFALPKK